MNSNNTLLNLNPVNAIENMGNDSRQGVFFGINSGIITTVGLIAGISQTTTNPMFIVISVLSIAISDGIGEAYGIFLSKKAEHTDDNSEGPLLSLISLFLAKFLTVVFFLFPLLFSWNLKYFKNLVWPLIWSLIMLTLIDIKLSKMRKEPIYKFVVPHYILLLVVLVITKYIGILLNKYK